MQDDGKDVDVIQKAIAAAKASTDKPTLIKVKAIIGYGTFNEAGGHDAHGAPLAPMPSPRRRRLIAFWDDRVLGRQRLHHRGPRLAGAHGPGRQHTRGRRQEGDRGG